MYIHTPEPCGPASPSPSFISAIPPHADSISASVSLPELPAFLPAMDLFHFLFHGLLPTPLPYTLINAFDNLLTPLLSIHPPSMCSTNQHTLACHILMGSNGQKC